MRARRVLLGFADAHQLARRLRGVFAARVAAGTHQVVDGVALAGEPGGGARDAEVRIVGVRRDDEVGRQ